MNKLIILIFSFFEFTAFAAAPFGDGFASGKLDDYLDNLQSVQNKVVLKSVVGMTGKSCLSITDNSKVDFKTVAVDPKTKYTLSFRAAFTGGEAIEENPRLDVSVMPGGFLSTLPSRDFQFFDAAKKPVQLWPPLGSGMPFREWHEYRDTFYPPPQAASMRLIIRSAPGITILIDNMKFEKTPDEGAININPDFNYGLYNYSGWATVAAGGKLFELKDGKIAFDSKYGSRSASFPISEPGTYALSAKATGNGYNFNIGLYLCDEKGKETGVFNRRANPTYFVLPPGTVRGSFLIYSSVLEELRLVRVGDENKINELLKK